MDQKPEYMLCDIGVMRDRVKLGYRISVRDFVHRVQRGAILDDKSYHIAGRVLAKLSRKNAESVRVYLFIVDESHGMFVKLEGEHAVVGRNIKINDVVVLDKLLMPLNVYEPVTCSRIFGKIGAGGAVGIISRDALESELMHELAVISKFVRWQSLRVLNFGVANRRIRYCFFGRLSQISEITFNEELKLPVVVATFTDCESRDVVRCRFLCDLAQQVDEYREVLAKGCCIGLIGCGRWGVAALMSVNLILWSPARFYQ